MVHLCYIYMVYIWLFNKKNDVYHQWFFGHILWEHPTGIRAQVIKSNLFLFDLFLQTWQKGVILLPQVISNKRFQIPREKLQGSQTLSSTNIFLVLTKLSATKSTGVLIAGW